MSKVVLITGGVRSGKSSYAEGLARQSEPVLYIATAEATDEEMRERIAMHKAARPASWLTWERYRGMAELPASIDSDSYGSILLDCIGNMLNNVLFHREFDSDTCSSSVYDKVQDDVCREISDLVAAARLMGKDLIIVTNEVGLGLVPADRLSRYYRDMMGRANALAARLADEVYLMVCGMPLRIK